VASLLPNSPRARRRLIVAAAVLVAAGAAVLVVLLIPNNHGGIASSSGTETVQLVKRQKQIRVTPRMRASINAPSTSSCRVPLPAKIRPPSAPS